MVVPVDGSQRGQSKMAVSHQQAGMAMLCRRVERNPGTLMMGGATGLMRKRQTSDTTGSPQSSKGKSSSFVSAIGTNEESNYSSLVVDKPVHVLVVK